MRECSGNSQQSTDSTAMAIEANLTKKAAKVRSTTTFTYRDRFSKELDSYLYEPNARKIAIH
jgi:hypothetical protein